MPIKRCSNHPQSLEEFYEDERWTHSAFKKISTETLKILEWLNEKFKDTLIFGFTSHQRLILVKENDSSSKNQIIISMSCIDHHYIQYAMPPDIAPWKDAYITGTAYNLEDAKKLISIAIKNCGEWADSEEVKKL